MLKNLQGALLSLLVLSAPSAFAKVKLPACITDNMVLQQKTQVNLWGKAEAGRTVTITPTWNNKKYTVVATATGDWKVKVPTAAYGGPYTITFNDGEATTLKNILLGEVWVCSGQSNMEMQLSGFYGSVINIDKELADANYPEIRTIKVKTRTALQAQDELITESDWQLCSPETVKGFTAVGYFFAKDFYKKHHIPVGIINTTWGGTISEAWTSGEALKTIPAFAADVKVMEAGMTQEQMNAKYDNDMRAWINATNAKDPLYANGKLPWIQPGYDLSAWKKIAMPSFWEKVGLPDVDGAMALVKTFTIPEKWAGHDLILNLGVIDDHDVTWFNGEEVGNTIWFFSKRSYKIPGKLVKAGENTVAIRVLDMGGMGGLNGGPLEVVDAATGEKIDLTGDWSYKLVNKVIDIPFMPSRPDGANRPTVIYNAMVNPILNYTIKGVLWYQGESNADRAYQYRTIFPLLIKDWRKQWGQGDFPFYFVQLANYMPQDKQPAESAWAELREAQTMTLTLPNTGMAVIIDIGDGGNIHPANKQDVGKRLALIARAKTYGEKIAYSGPMYKSYAVKGNTIEVAFNFADGLKAKGDKLTGFAIAGADKKFHWADARIEGNKVIVSSPEVANPVAVRYAWGNNPVCNLYNAADLPASPFRTDAWQGITFGKE